MIEPLPTAVRVMAGVPSSYAPRVFTEVAVGVSPPYVPAGAVNGPHKTVVPVVPAAIVSRSTYPSSKALVRQP